MVKEIRIKRNVTTWKRISNVGKKYSSFFHFLFLFFFLLSFSLLLIFFFFSPNDPLPLKLSKSAPTHNPPSPTFFFCSSLSNLRKLVSHPFLTLLVSRRPAPQKCRLSSLFRRRRWSTAASGGGERESCIFGCSSSYFLVFNFIFLIFPFVFTVLGRPALDGRFPASFTAAAASHNSYNTKIILR